MFPIVRNLRQCVEGRREMRGYRFSLLSVWCFDWEQMREMRGASAFFCRDAELYTDSRDSAALVRVSCSRFPYALLVRRYVQADASVTMEWNCRTILWSWIECGNEAAVSEALGRRRRSLTSPSGLLLMVASQCFAFCARWTMKSPLPLC